MQDCILGDVVYHTFGVGAGNFLAFCEVDLRFCGSGRHGGRSFELEVEIEPEVGCGAVDGIAQAPYGRLAGVSDCS